MDKATRIIGYIGLIPLLIGSLFKIQYWPGGGLLIVLSVSLLVMAFMPMFIVHRITKRTSTLGMIEGIVLGVTGVFVLLGMLFKIQHWPGGGMMMVVGNTLLAFAIGVMIVRAMEAKEYKQSWSMLGFMFAMTLVFFGWALNWSRDFLVAIEHNDAMIQQSEEAMMLSNEALRAQFNANDSLSKEWSEISRHSAAMVDYIQRLQNLIITGCLGQSPSIESYASANDVWAKDNYDIPTKILIGYDPASPTQDEYSAFSLRIKLTEYAAAMKGLIENLETQSMIDSLYSFQDQTSNGMVYSWEVMHFYHASFASVMQTLNTLRLSVAVTENRMLHQALQSELKTAVD